MSGTLAIASHVRMTKPHSTRLLETDFDEYLELRINQLGLPATVADIRTSAFGFQKQIGLVHNQANALLALGIITLFAIVVLPLPPPASTIITCVSCGESGITVVKVLRESSRGPRSPTPGSST